jgi:hypothetical protein
MADRRLAAPYVEADELITDDRRLLAAAKAHGVVAVRARADRGAGPAPR